MNRKPLIIAFPLFLIALFISCKKENWKKTAKETDQVVYAETTIDTTAEVKEGDTLQKVGEIVFVLGMLKDQALLELKKPTKNQANESYDNYWENCERNIEYLNKLEGNITANFYNYYDSKKGKFLFPDDVKKHVDTIQSGGLEFWDVGEGYTEIRFKPYHYYNLYKSKVSDDYKYFLKTEAKEETVLYMGDAALIITFKELGDRILSWEKFITTYPKSPLLPRVTKKYQEYVVNYLFGLDNTSTYEYEDTDNSSKMVLNKENRDEFNRFIAKNPKSNCTRIIKLFLSRFDNGVIYEELVKFVHDELKIEEEPDYDTP
jgi:hypothetical protein